MYRQKTVQKGKGNPKENPKLNLCTSFTYIPENYTLTGEGHLSSLKTSFLIAH